MQANSDTNTGVKDLAQLRTRGLRNCPAYATMINAGKVPAPNSIMNIEPDKILPVDNAPAKAMYTNPHGKKAFKNPMRDSVYGELMPKILMANIFHLLLIPCINFEVTNLLEKNKSNNIKTPASMESLFCRPAIAKPFPNIPANIPINA